MSMNNSLDEPGQLIHPRFIMQDARGDIGYPSEDLQVVLQQHKAIFSSKRQDILPVMPPSRNMVQQLAGGQEKRG
jgi:hypothetical protein